MPPFSRVMARASASDRKRMRGGWDGESVSGGGADCTTPAVNKATIRQRFVRIITGPPEVPGEGRSRRWPCIAKPADFASARFSLLLPADEDAREEHEQTTDDNLKDRRCPR